MELLSAAGIGAVAGCSGDGSETPTTEGPTSTSPAPGGSPTPTPTEGGTPTDTPAPTGTPVDEPDDQIPPAVSPADTMGDPPGDATVLFGGDSLENWESSENGCCNSSGPNPGPEEPTEALWNLNAEEGYFEVEPGTGPLWSKETFGDCHFHLEFRPPDNVDRDAGQASGNSGVFMMDRYEFQVLNNYENETGNNQYAGAYYSQSGAAPLVDPARPPTEWQTYDIIWRGPRFDGDTVTRPGMAVVFLNGVVVQAHLNLQGKNWIRIRGYNSHAPEEAVRLQDHDHYVRFRNIWYRPIPQQSETGGVSEHAPDYSNTSDYSQPLYDPLDDGERPEPTAPGDSFRDPPEDATTLLGEDGSLEGWESADGGDPGWREEDGYVAVEPGAGNIQTSEDIGDCQLHTEFRIPESVSGDGANRGNSGILLSNRFEVQILDNYDNVSQPTRWAGAYTGQAAPLASPVKEQGEWQSFDIVWQGPRFADGGATFERAARMTVLLNGVVVQKRLYLDGPNKDGTVSEYAGDPGVAPLGLQDGDDPVHFRNTWYRPLD